jgi:aminomethyltransferase
MRFMDAGPRRVDGIDCFVSRSGYTGEDGFEISVPANRPRRWRRRCSRTATCCDRPWRTRQPAARGRTLSLWARHRRTTTPVEGALEWSIQKSRRHGGVRAGGFPGADRILSELANGATRRRVGLRPEGRAPVREGAPLFADAASSAQIGAVTSGGFGPSVNAPVAMGYLPSSHATPGRSGVCRIARKRLPLLIAPMPFVPNTYKR